jgi:hypothetical protein
MSEGHRQQDPGTRALVLMQKLIKEIPEHLGLVVRLLEQLHELGSRGGRIVQLKEMVSRPANAGLTIFTKGRSGK